MRRRGVKVKTRAQQLIPVRFHATVLPQGQRRRTTMQGQMMHRILKNLKLFLRKNMHSC